MSAKKERAEVELIINGQNANATLRNLEAAARKAKSELKGMLPGSEDFNKAAANVAKIDKALQNTRVQAGLTKSSWDKMKESIQSSFIGNLGANMATLGLQKLVGYFTDAWSSAKKLSDQMADIGRTTGLTAEEVKSLNKELSKIDTRTSMSDLREIAIVAGQFGVAREQVAGFVEAVDRINVVMGGEFGGNAEMVATEMSKLRNVFTDIKSDDIGTDIGFISNAVNKLAQEGVATAPVVSDMANRIGGYGIQVGLTTGQVLGLSATLQELNVSTERGGTAVVKILQKMLTNTTDFAAIAGMEVGQFKKLLNEDLYGAFVKVMEGSKKMGGSSTLLAGIIKELEVQGAGASEVFAKLGSNTGMLHEKVLLANGSLTNTNSITEQATLKQENFAGSVDRLGKSWDKLTSNPAIVSFFKGIIDFTTDAISGMNDFSDIVSYNWDIVTVGKTKADQMFFEKKKLRDMEAGKDEDKNMRTRVAGQVNYYKQLSEAELKLLIKKKEDLYKFDLEEIKALQSKGMQKEAAIQIQLSKENVLETKAAREVLAMKIEAGKRGLDEKVKLTEKEIAALEKQKKKEERVIAKADKEREGYEKSREKYEAEVFQKTMYSQIDAMKELHDLEKELDTDSVEGEMKRLEAHAAKWEGVLKDIAKWDKENKLIMVDNANYLASETFGVLQGLSNMQSAHMHNDLTKDRKANDEKKKNLKDQLDKKIITQEEYDQKVANIDSAAASRESEAMKKQAQQQKAISVFEATIKAILMWIEASLKPTKIPAAIFATAQAGILAATPIPEFEQGGFTGDEAMGVYNGKGFAGITHPNEYVINAKQLRNPYVYNFARSLEQQKKNGNTDMSSNGGQPQVIIHSDPEVKELLMHLKTKGVQGVWDWDYEKRTSARMADLETRRKM